jgi:3-oxoacyl-[acyl-carrier protein] reductase
MDLELNDKVALVAASSTGLGKAVAIGLAEEGANVIICSRDSDKLKLVSEEIQKKGRRCLAIPINLTNYSQVQDLVTRSIKHFGKIDILVTNCGGPPSGEFLDFSIEDWKRAIDLNLMSTIYLCREVIPHMVFQNKGQIVMITSVSVKQPIQGLILSNVARAGVAGLAKSLSNEFGKNNILVNIVCPGYTQTQRVNQLAMDLSAEQGLKPEKMIQKWAKLNALGRIATPEEFANVVVFLASERASHLTGTAIQIDGGLVKSLL